MNQYANVLQKLTTVLSNRTPRLANPQELTDRILLRIHELPQETQLANKPLYPGLVWLRIASCSAAIFLFCLFFAQQENGQVHTKTTPTVILQKKTVDATCSTQTASNRPYFRQMLLCQFLENTSKNERFRNRTQNKNPKRI